MATQQKQQKQLESGEIIADFVNSLPEYIRCTSDFDKGLQKPTLKSTALNEDYIQFNESNCIAWLVFDIDRGWLSINAWHDANVAEPNFILQNPQSGNCHYFYKLKTPVFLKTSAESQVRTAPEDYMNAIRDAMTCALKADPCYTHQICKNPLSKKVRALELHNYPYDLVTLAGNLSLKSKFSAYQAKKVAAKNDDNYVLGRNCSLFDDLRFYAYSIVKKAKSGSFNDFLQELTDYAANLNSQFSETLPVNEVRHTVKSVATWTWNKFTGQPETCNRGAMGFGQTRRDNPELVALSEEEIKKRQRAAAKRTHEIKRTTTAEKIKATITALIEAKEILNNTVIAEKAGLSRKTISVFSKGFKGCVDWWYQVEIQLTGFSQLLNLFKQKPPLKSLTLWRVSVNTESFNKFCVFSEGKFDFFYNVLNLKSCFRC